MVVDFAQMAILHFIIAGKDTTFVPASVYCDHLTLAQSGAVADLIMNHRLNGLKREAL